MFNDYFYKWYPEIYRDNTLHLTAEQDGIYRRLIDHYMISRQPLPDNEAALARIAGVDISTMVATLVELRLFFGSTNGKLTHGFCDKLLDEQDARSRKQSDRGKKSAEKRKIKAIDKQANFNAGSTTASTALQQIEIEKEIKKERVTNVTLKKESFYSEEFETFWTTYPKNKGSKKTAGEKYESAIRSGISHEQLRAGARAYADDIKRQGTELQYIAHAATWLHQKRWDVDYTDDKPSAARTPNGKYDNRDPATRARDIGESIIAKRNAAEAERLRAESKPTDHPTLPNICQPENIRREGGNDGIPRPNVSGNSGGL